jgi:hypothetical protein
MIAATMMSGHPVPVLSKKVEFEPGIGPSLSSSGQFGATASFEFMIWRLGKSGSLAGS